MTYIGETNDRGEPHGQGIHEYADDERYEGQFNYGRLISYQNSFFRFHQAN